MPDSANKLPDITPDLAEARRAFLARAKKTPKKPRAIPGHAPGDDQGDNAGKDASAKPSNIATPRTTKRGGPRAHYRDAQPGYGSPAPESILGRPRIWSDAARESWQTALLLHLIDGQSLMGFCRAHPEGPSRFTFIQWIEEQPSFAALYSRARENGADAMADDILSIADGVKDAGPTDSARVNAARLRVDARKWSASKLKPGVYADRVETSVNVSGSITHKTSDADRALALASLMARMAITNSDSLPDAMRALQTIEPGKAVLTLEGETIKTSPAPAPPTERK